MARGDFSVAAHYNPVLLELNKLWDPSVLNDSIKAPTTTAQVALQRHGMRAQPILDTNGKCVTYRTYWMNDCDYTADYSDNAPDAALDCLPPEGDENEAFSKDYVPNIAIRDTSRYVDQDCDSLLFNVERTAETINRSLKAVRKAIADRVTGDLLANAQANTYTALNAPGTINGTVTEFNASEFGTLKTLMSMKLIAMKNQIDNYVVVNGTNFWDIYHTSQAGACCEDGTQRNIAGMNDVFFDIWLDEAAASYPTLVFDPRRVGFLNKTRFTNTAPEKMHGYHDSAVGGAAVSEVYKWVINDPFYMHLRTNSDGSTSLVPVQYDVEYVKRCIGRDSESNMKYAHDYTVYFRGGFYLSPNNCRAGDTGILQFEQV